MNLAIDIGNTTTKIALFDKNQLVEFNDNVDLNKVISWINKKQVDKAIVSSVKLEPPLVPPRGGNKKPPPRGGRCPVDIGPALQEAGGLKDIERLLKSVSKHCKIIELDHRTPLPINNLYETPQTMGMDRLAAVVGANHLYRENNCLVIDAGTCITFDFIDKNNNYHGGSISPGIDVKFKALHNFAAQLPLLKKEIKEIKEFDLIGKNTHDAIESGVINGTIAELEGIISAFRSKFDDLTVILCGGDAKFFEKTKSSHLCGAGIGFNRVE
ncbi:MAG: type III pantothenate kinase [Bacteroidetes bacterium]|nr:type III pantothenate kinase [Bacteroidota bacterium]